MLTTLSGKYKNPPFVLPNDLYHKATKVIIVNPVAKELMTGKDGRNVPIDNGDDVGGYKVYAGTAFVNALRRDTVDKKG